MRTPLIYCIGIVLLATQWNSSIILAATKETALELTNNQLINRLSHGSLDARDQAAKILSSRGRSALAAIEEAIPLTDCEAAFRLSRLAAAIALVETSRKIAPSTVTISLVDESLDEIIRQITIQTENRILATDTAATAHLSCNKLPFWKAMEKLAAAIDGHIFLVDRPPGLGIATVLPTSHHVLPATSSNLIYVATQRIDPLGTAGERGFRIVLRVAWEPRLTPIMIRLSMASIVAESETGATIRQPSRLGVLEPIIIKDRCWVDLPFVLGPPPAGITQLATLRGTIEMWLPGFEHNFQVPLLSSEQEMRKPRSCLGTMTIELEDWWLTTTPAGRGLTLQATARLSQSSEACDSHRGWLADQVPKVFPVGGPALDAIAHGVVGRSDRGLTMQATFAPLQPIQADELRMSWSIPVGVSKIPVDFWLRNIPLEKRFDIEKNRSK